MVHGIFRQAANPDLAMRLLRRLVSVEAQVEMSRATGQLPSRSTAFPVVSGDTEFMAATLDLLSNAFVRPATTTYRRVSAQLQTMLESVILGVRTPSDASHRAAEMIGAITGLSGSGEANQW